MHEPMTHTLRGPAQLDLDDTLVGLIGAAATDDGPVAGLLVREPAVAARRVDVRAGDAVALGDGRLLTIRSVDDAGRGGRAEVVLTVGRA